jgi:hypothetical protein
VSLLGIPKPKKTHAMFSAGVIKIGSWIAPEGCPSIGVRLERVPVKIPRWCLTLILLGLSCSAGYADGVDPGVKLQGGGDATGLFSPNDPNFTFTVFGSNFTAVGQSEEFDFINFTNQQVIGVNLVATLLPGTPTLTYVPDPISEYFTMSQVTPLSPTVTLISFSDPNTGEGGFGGIPFATDFGEGSCDGPRSCSTSTPGADFGVVITDINGDLVDLAGRQGFTVQGTLLVPEPSTIFLVLAAGVLLFLFKRSQEISVPRLGR